MPIQSETYNGYGHMLASREVGLVLKVVEYSEPQTRYLGYAFCGLILDECMGTENTDKPLPRPAAAMHMLIGCIRGARLTRTEGDSLILMCSLMVTERI